MVFSPLIFSACFKNTFTTLQVVFTRAPFCAIIYGITKEKDNLRFGKIIITRGREWNTKVKDGQSQCLKINQL